MQRHGRDSIESNVRQRLILVDIASFMIAFSDDGDAVFDPSYIHKRSFIHYINGRKQIKLQTETRNILDCDQSNYSSRIILAHIPAKLLS